MRILTNWGRKTPGRQTPVGLCPRPFIESYFCDRAAIALLKASRVSFTRPYAATCLRSPSNFLFQLFVTAQMLEVIL